MRAKVGSLAFCDSPAALQAQALLTYEANREKRSTSCSRSAHSWAGRKKLGRNDDESEMDRAAAFTENRLEDHHWRARCRNMTPPSHIHTYPSVWAHQCEFLQQFAKDRSVCFPEWMDGALSIQNTSLWLRNSLNHLKSFSFDESNRHVKSHKDFHSFTHCTAT